MKSYQFNGILTESGWLENAVISVDSNGIITSIGPQKNTETEVVNGLALPGFQNAHSHAFQYAMAGLAELHDGAGNPDDFWSWRTAMYELALQFSPEQLEDIATMLYAEMLRNGYTSVAEFHYVHHDKNGKEYANLAELGERLVAAAKRAGIRITLVPMFYQMGGFGKPAEDKQRRFISKTVDDYYRLLERSKEVAKNYRKATVAMGIHSLRAVKGEDIIRVSEEFQNDIPFHIHIAEQLKEIKDCEQFYGKRPVEWMLEKVDLNELFHLVHATHLNDAEVRGIAEVKANVVLCPTTEGNLGDGLFRFHDFNKLGGSWSIGTDSHVSINPLEELRLLDYGQRVTTHQRTTFYQHGRGESGFNALKQAWQAGRKATASSSEQFFQIGAPFDAVVIDANAPLIASSSPKNWCNTIVYSSDVSHVLGTLVQGKWVVKYGQYPSKTDIYQRFTKTMLELKSRL